MLIRSVEGGPTHDEPVCRTGCGGFAAAPNPLCKGEHGQESPDDIMRRICAAVGHIQSDRTTFCLRCREPAPAETP